MKRLLIALIRRAATFGRQLACHHFPAYVGLEVTPRGSCIVGVCTKCKQRRVGRHPVRVV